MAHTYTAMFSGLKALDAFPKVNEDFYARSVSGGVITLGASLIMAALFFNELGEVVHCWGRLSQASFLLADGPLPSRDILVATDCE